jgi:hypothetical protein
VLWPNYFGYSTAEGRGLNEVAREAGDNPDDWYIAERPVDVLQATEFWAARDRSRPTRLQRAGHYIAEIHRMVKLCREFPTASVAPSWIKSPQELESLIGRPIERL